MTAAIANYIQQNITPNLNYYLAVGISLAAVGIVIVAIGDRKPKMSHGQAPPKLQQS
jgi:hypothetical protein